MYVVAGDIAVERSKPGCVAVIVQDIYAVVFGTDVKLGTGSDYRTDDLAVCGVFLRAGQEEVKHVEMVIGHIHSAEECTYPKIVVLIAIEAMDSIVIEAPDIVFLTCYEFCA